MASANDVINIALRRVGAARVSNWSSDTSKEAIVARDVFHGARKDVLGMHHWNRATRRVQLTELTAAPGFGWDNAFGLPDDFIRVVSVHPSDNEHAVVPYKLEFINDTTTATIVVVDFSNLAGATIQFEGINIVTTTLTEGTDFTAVTSNSVTADNIVTAMGTTTTTGIIGLTASNSAGTITVTSANGYTLQNITLSDAVNTTRTNPSITPQYSLFANSDTIFLRYIFDLADINIWSSMMCDVLALRLARDFAVAIAHDESMAEGLERLYQKKLSRIKAVDGIEDWPEQRPEGSWVTARFGGRDFSINTG